MRTLLFVFLLIFSTHFRAQVLVLTFKDNKTAEAIPNVACQFTYEALSDNSPSIRDTASQNGQVSFQIKANELNTNLIISYTHPIYQGGAKTILPDSKQDTLRFDIFLKAEKIQVVADIYVRPNRPDTVFSSKIYHVEDFELGARGELFLLSYEKNLQKDAQLQCIWNDTTLFLQNIPERASALKRDFRGNIHVETATNMYGIQRIDSSLQLGSIPKDYFYKYIAPIVDTSLTRQYFSSYIDIYPAFEYGSIDQLDSTYRSILQIQDDLMMELYRSEYKWVDVRAKLWAKNLELQTGIDAEVYVGANYFTQSLYYQPVYAPLFLVQDTLYIFDYPKDMLRVYSSSGQLLRSTPIFHHYQAKETGFRKNLQQDRSTGEIYAVYEKDGYTYLGAIDLKTGQVRYKAKMAYRYIEKIRVHNGAAYYIYRPFESTQKKFLYRQKLLR
ncbi:MAG: hypothetical protein ACKOBN_02615 [Flavobacteriales bacterium]